MAKVFERPHALSDVTLHYCPGCTHGIVHRLVAEVIDELELKEIRLAWLLLVAAYFHIIILSVICRRPPMAGHQRWQQELNVR